MMLASAEAIRELVNQASATTGRSQNRTGLQSSRARRRRQCRCGKCAECKENARWDRIFREKFADPNYYELRGPRAVSPLTAL